MISAYRGDHELAEELKKIHSKMVISPITVMELYKGAKTKERKHELEKQLKSYSVVSINKDVCEKAIGLMKRYQTGKRDVFIPDCIMQLPAYDIQLYTVNKADFDFMENIRFYK